MSMEIEKEEGEGFTVNCSHSQIIGYLSHDLPIILKLCLNAQIY